MADKGILEFVQSSKNITETDSDDENGINNAAPVPTSSEMKSVLKIWTWEWLFPEGSVYSSKLFSGELGSFMQSSFSSPICHLFPCHERSISWKPSDFSGLAFRWPYDSLQCLQCVFAHFLDVDHHFQALSNGGLHQTLFVKEHSANELSFSLLKQL
ncbi:hypothetical protein TNCV_287551 [Trichonephila clavipes]|nr:hypothetical protein TNCV_287551 [Trichonephila clavipes]